MLKNQEFWANNQESGIMAKDQEIPIISDRMGGLCMYNCI